MPFSSPGDFPNPGIKPGSPALKADSLPTELRGKPSIWVYLFFSLQFSQFLPQVLDALLLGAYTSIVMSSWRIDPFSIM